MREKLWFKAKSYGYGWYPSTWQGWLVILIYLCAMFGSFFLADSNSHSVSDALINFIPNVILFTIVLIIISYLKGEKARWNWGKSSKI